MTMEFGATTPVVAEQERPAWRVDVLTDENAGEGLIYPYSCLFTMKGYWDYGYFRSRESCELPGHLFRARAGGTKGPERAFLVPALWWKVNRYHMIDGRLYVAWRVRPPTECVGGGRFSYVAPSAGPWEVWCNRTPDGEIEWTVKTTENEKDLEHSISYEANSDEFVTVQLILDSNELQIEWNGEIVGRFDHDAYSEEFYLQFGSSQPCRDGAEVVSEFREVFVNVIPYPCRGVSVTEGPEDVRDEDHAVVSFLCEATPDSPRYTEGDIAVLDNKTLLAVYTHYYEGVGHDFSPARLEAKSSRDGGRTWSEPWIVAEPEEGSNGNVMSASLIAGLNGDLLLAYYDKTPEMQARGMVLRRSTDGGQTWSERIPITPPASSNVHIANNACLTRLTNGRLILACREYTPLRRPYACYSDDDGRTWRQGKLVPQPELSDYERETENINEPMICETPDNQLLMTARSKAGGQFFTYSPDGGETWTPPFLSPLRGTCSPACIRRIPDRDDILAIWTYDYGTRTRLISAISSDGGQSWRNLKMLEQSLYHGSCYVSCTFHEDRVYLTYMYYPNFSSLFRFPCEPGYKDLRFLSLPVAWFSRTV